jgi:GNAT superfamily N-acetyltransferase
MHIEVRHGEFTLSDDPDRLDFSAIHHFLSNSYWGRQRPRELLRKGISNSFCFGMYRGRDQVGFARVITDYATFGYLADVYILEPYRRQGLGSWMVNHILSHPRLKDLRRWALVTEDAQELYRRCGFTELQFPKQHMQRLQPYPATSPHVA